MENNITYILTHHSENTLRDNNLSTVLSWLKSLKGDKKIEIPNNRRKGSGKSIKLNNVTGNNLKDIDFFN